MRTRGLLLGLLGLTAGAALGWRLAGAEMSRRREDLFHAQPLRRLAALAWLEELRTPESIALVQDYLHWERQPVLRRRAARLLRHLEAGLA